MTKTRQWATLTAVACLAILAAGWFIAVKPQRSHAASLRAQTESVQSSNNGLRSQVNQLRQQQKDLPAQQKLLSQIATKIPDNPALPSLIRQLSAAADGAGANLVSIAPGVPALASARSASGTTVGTSTASAAPLAAIPLTIQVQGSYFNIEQFFSAVESLSRAMLVTGFTLAPGGAPGAAGTAPSGNLMGSITASVFESPSLASSAAAPTTSTPASTTTGH